jgi:hypothetical protein
MLNKVSYRGQVVNGPSYDLWSDCPVAEMDQDPNIGFHFYDNFSICPTITTAKTANTGTAASGLTAIPSTWDATAGAYVMNDFASILRDLRAGGYSYYNDDGVVLGPAGLQGGGLLISGNDADNDEGTIQAGGGGLVISDTASAARKLWFEACIQKASIGDNGLGFFLGLMTPGSAAANILVDNTAAMAASKGYVGFRVLQDNGEEVDFVHADSTGAVVEWGADVVDMEAATDIKLGFKYDPDCDKKIRLWIDGVEYVSDWLVAADIALSTFPDGDVLSPMFATKVGTAAEVLTCMKWWRWAQLAV